MDFKNKIILGPMAGVTDLPFRLLSKKCGVDIVVTEMVSAKGLMYNPKSADELLITIHEEGPVGVQLFGSDPEIISTEAAKLLERIHFDFIDINMGCPVPKIVNNGEGSALMQDPALCGRIVEAIVKKVDVPVTAKIRAGFHKDVKNAPEVAKALEQAGASAVAVHGRTREEYYFGHADWDVIRKVKEVVTIPVIGNGDITCAADVVKMKEETGCDSVMVARHARGNPWIFREIKEELETGVKPDRPSIEEIREMMKEHLYLMLKYKGEYTAVHEMRKHIQWYTTGLPNSAQLRRKINEIEDFNELLQTIECTGK
ncbi:MAG: tRNA dihydrouridine synthase DusB [Eubacterium sp.]|nr:tRNA dihydrouridine synthase DusB [Eubacterium sp.]